MPFLLHNPHHKSSELFVVYMDETCNLLKFDDSVLSKMSSALLACFLSKCEDRNVSIIIA